MPPITRARIIRLLFGHDLLFEKEAKLNAGGEINFFRDNAEPLPHDMDSTKYLHEFNQSMASVICPILAKSIVEWNDEHIIEFFEQSGCEPSELALPYIV